MYNPSSYALAAILWAALASPACSLADLRTDAMLNGELSADAEQRGREWLDRAAAAHGKAALDSKTTISLWMRDEWPSALMRTLAMPWPQNRQLLRLDMIIGSDNGRLTFEEGDEQRTGWGIQNWVTYRFGKGGAVEFDAPDSPDGTIKFWIPTLAYFPMLPFRLQDASYVRWLGTDTVDGRRLAKIFVTWGEPDPSEAVDQYIVWIDEESHLVAGTRFTVRDIMGSVVGTQKYSDYRAFDGVKVPQVINGVSDLASDETESHLMTFERAAFDEVASKALVPKPDLRAAK